MMSTLILTSSGLSDEKVRTAVRARVDFSRHKKVAMITTAAPEKERSPYVRSDHHELKKMDFAEIDFFDAEKEDASRLRDYDVIYVAGGNTFYLLHHLRKSRVDAVLKNTLRSRPTLYIGVSAGSIIVGKSIASSTDENAVGLQDLTGLELLDAVIIPHFGDHKKEIYERMIEHGHRAIRIRDGHALIIEDGKELFV